MVEVVSVTIWARRRLGRLILVVWVAVLLLGAALLVLPEPRKVPLVGPTSWEVNGGFDGTARPAPEEVSRIILENRKSVFWRSWAPRSSNTGLVFSSPFVAPAVLAVPFAGYPGHTGIELYLECMATSARRRIARGDPHENWVERTLWLGPSWCPSDVRLVAASSTHASYVAVGTPFRSSWLSYMKESVFVVTLVHALGWAVLLAPGLAAGLVMRIRRPDVALLAAVPITLALGYVSFFAIYLAGRAAVAAVVVIMVASVIVVAAHARRAWSRFRSQPVARAFALAFAISLAYTLAVYAADMGNGSWAATDRFAPAIWSSDAQLPQMVAEGIYHQRPIATMIGGGWHVSDRPPVLSGLFLLGRSVWEPLLGIGDNRRLAYLFYQITGAVACTLWVIPAWMLLARARPGPEYATRGTLLLAATGVILFNSVYVWPKMLAGALGLAAYIVLTMPESAPARRPWVYAAAGGLAGMALMSHGGVVFGLVPVFALLLWRPTRAGVEGLAIAGLAALVVVLPWAVWQRTVDPPGNALVKFALAGTWGIEDPAKGIWATVRDAHATMTIADWLRMRRNSLFTLFGSSRSPLISRYWLQESDVIGWRRAADFLFLFPALRAMNLGFLALALILGARSPEKQGGRLAASWIAIGLWGVAVATLVNFSINIVHCQSYLSILLLLLGLYAALSNGPLWLYRSAVALHVIYFAVVWVWSPLAGADLRLDTLAGFLLVTTGLIVVLLPPRRAPADSAASGPASADA